MNINVCKKQGCNNHVEFEKSTYCKDHACTFPFCRKPRSEDMNKFDCCEEHYPKVKQEYFKFLNLVKKNKQ